MPSIRDIPYPIDLAPIAQEVSVMCSVPLDTCEAITLFMQTMCIMHINDVASISVESCSTYAAIWLLLAKPLGVTEANMTRAITMALSLCAKMMRTKMEKHLTGMGIQVDTLRRIES